MALPEQIRRQSAEVKSFYDQSNAGQQPAGDSPTDTLPPANDTVETPQSDSTGEEGATQPPVSEQNTGASNPDDENSETYAQRWRSLQGSYNATVRQKSMLEQRVSQLEELLSTISKQPSAPQQAADPAPQTPAPTQRLVTDKDVEEYGESIDVMRRVSQDVLGPVLARIGQLESVLQQMQATVVPQVTAVSQRQQMSAEQQFWSDLNTYVPNWQEINNNDGFQNWLLEVDPLTGNTRQTFLEAAQQSLDAYRVSAFFRTWLESTGQATVAQNAPTPPAQTELEKQVTPGRSRSAAAPQGNQPKKYSPADIKKFYDDVRTGKYKGREQERARIERDIFSAQREGRIAVNT
jgi:hypothetical protein